METSIGLELGHSSHSLAGTATSLCPSGGNHVSRAFKFLLVSLQLDVVS